MPNSSKHAAKHAVHVHLKHFPSLFSALFSLDLLGWEEMRDAGDAHFPTISGCIDQLWFLTYLLTFLGQ